MSDKTGKRILYAVLNWGYGHTVHSFPLIEHLNKNHDVILAADGKARILLQRRFPENLCIHLKDARINYSQKKALMPVYLAIQAVKMLLGMGREHRITNNLVKNMKIDRIISDNRYGVWNKYIPSFLITHQLRFRMPFRKLEGLSLFFNRLIFKGFSAVWVIDSPDINLNLSGDLSHNNPLSAHPKVRFMGLWSDLKPIAIKEDIDLLVILSGPEPQRTVFENILIEQFSGLIGNFVLVRGTEKPEIKTMESLEIIGLADRTTINNLIARSRMVICRSGYTSTMDLVRMGKKAIMVPTPGQSEQEYQAELYHKRGWFYSVSQDALDLTVDRKKAIEYSPPDIKEWFNRTDLLDEAIREWLKHRIKR